MTTFNGTKFHDTLFGFGPSDLVSGHAGSDTRGAIIVFDYEGQPLAGGGISDLIPDIAGNDAPTGDAGSGSVELAKHESTTRPHADGVLVLHGDFSTLADPGVAIAAATEELFGNYNFVYIEPTASELDPGVKTRVAHEGPIDNAGDSLVATALLHGDFSSLTERAAGGAGTEDLLGAYNFIAVEPTASEIAPGVRSEVAQDGSIGDAGGNGNEARIVGFVDGTSNTIGFAENNVVENVNVKYTFSGAEDDPVAGLKFDTDVVDVVTDNKDPKLLVAHAVAGGSGNGVTILDGISGNGNNALSSRAGGEVISADSYVIIGPTGTISDSGKDARLADITDGTSNTFALARTDVVNTNLLETMSDISDSGDDARSAGVKDGLSNTIMVGERTVGSAASNVVEAVAAKYTLFDGEADGLLLGGNGADRLVRQDDLGMHDLQIDGAFLDVGDLLIDVGADDRVSSDSGHYSLADGIEGDVSKNVANEPAGKENLNGNINNIDFWVGGVLDVGDVLVGLDDGVDNSNDSPQTRTAGGSTALQADPNGQANGIIAILIGLHTDIQGPPDSASLALD